MASGKKKFLEGNIAIVEGAISAGARFYAGYPITPSTEIAEYSSQVLPKVGGIFIQMEDEISSMAAVLGASVAGKKAYTATSGPGISLMQENIGLGIMAEIPAVIIDVQRCGPSTGAATKPAQGDMMQIRWGTHGDHSIIALSPATVQECFDLTVQAFNLAEKYRTPVYLLADEVIAHLRESVVIRDLGPDDIVNRRQPEEGTSQADMYPYNFDSDMPSPMPPIGSDKYLMRVTGSVHNEKGEFHPTQEYIDKCTHYLVRKIESHADDICMTKETYMDDCDIAFITYGCSTRSVREAVKCLRQEGVKAGVLQLQTIWPFPKKAVGKALKNAKTVFVVELNMGQAADEVRKLNTFGRDIVQINQVDGTLISPQRIIKEVKNYTHGLV